MIIFGKEKKFAMTVGAASEMAKMCPEGDLTRMGEIFDSGISFENVQKVAEMAIILSKAYEDRRRFEEPGYTPDPLTMEQALALTFDESMVLMQEILKTYSKDSEPSIEVEESKKEDGAKAV